MFVQIKAFSIWFFIGALLATSGFSQIDEPRILPPEYKSDGCSLFPDGNYRECCVAHDKLYYFGGTNKERSVADKELYECVKSKDGRNRKFVARIMWLGVRIGGVSFLPTPFRWGFGNKFPRKSPEKKSSTTESQPIGP